MRTPVIPLGIEARSFVAGPDTTDRASTLRQSLDIGPEDFVALFLGRLNFSSKANPYPMYLALEQAQARCTGKFHLIQAGWYPNEQMHTNTLRLAREMAPSVWVHSVGQVNGQARQDVYAAADVFISLSDNIQETFGLTVIEAMAAGLPVIASDWDGYRDTVADGVTGYLVPTTFPLPGIGIDLALTHGLMGREYNRYLLDVAQATAVDIDRTTEAVVRLAGSQSLRRRMGEAGRSRAFNNYDWPIIIKSYQDLWSNLEEARRASPVVHTAVAPPYPDPFSLFKTFASQTLSLSSVISLHQDWRPRFRSARESPLLSAPADLLVPAEIFDAMLEVLQRHRHAAVGALMDLHPSGKRRAMRAVMWLLKAGVIVVQRL